MRFDSTHIEQFRNDGFTSLPQLFTEEEVLALRREVERFRQLGLGRNVRTEGDGETHSQEETNYQVIPLYDKSDLIRALPFEPKVLDLITRLIGDPFLLHLDQLFLKPAGQGTGTAWHQDNAYFKIAGSAILK